MKTTRFRECRRCEAQYADLGPGKRNGIPAGFCSQHCYQEYKDPEQPVRKQRSTPLRHGTRTKTRKAYERPLVERVCAHCEAKFYAEREHKNYARKYCSQGCAGEAHKKRRRASWPSAEEVRRLYHDEGLTDKQLGARFGRSYQWALTVRKEYGIEGRPASYRSKATAARPSVQANGYVRLSDRWQHRVVAAEKIGRALLPGEVVHHIDGNPQNNHPDNLVVYPSHSEHMWDERGRNARKPSRRSTANRRRDWTEPRQKVEAEGRCRVCGCTSDVQAAHIVPRSQVEAGRGEHVDNIVPLCGDFGNGCHGQFDRGDLDLLPFLTLGEQAYSVLVHPGGMVGAYQRVTGGRLDDLESRRAA